MTSAVTASAVLSRQWQRPPFIANPRVRWALYVGAALYLVVGIGSLEVNWARAIQGLERGWVFVLGFLNPNFTSRLGRDRHWFSRKSDDDDHLHCTWRRVVNPSCRGRCPKPCANLGLSHLPQFCGLVSNAQ